MGSCVKGRIMSWMRVSYMRTQVENFWRTSRDAEQSNEKNANPRGWPVSTGAVGRVVVVVAIDIECTVLAYRPTQKKYFSKRARDLVGGTATPYTLWFLD